MSKGMSMEARQAASERMSAMHAAKHAVPGVESVGTTSETDERLAQSEPIKVTSGHPLVTRPTNRFRVGTTIPYPKKGVHYYWAADNRIHPQNMWRKKGEGWYLTDPREADSLGLSGYAEENTGEHVVVDVNNAIRFGDVVLMECTDEQFAYNMGIKLEQYNVLENSAERKAEEGIANVVEQYERTRRD